MADECAARWDRRWRWWVASLTTLIALGPEHVVPGHTRPLLGATNARDALRAYRDGIASVFDQTLEGMRKGERPDELVAHVKLPPSSRTASWPWTAPMSTRSVSKRRP